MRNKKLVFVLLAIMVLGLVVLAGCANTNDNTDNTQYSPMAVPGTIAPEGATQSPPVETNQTGTNTVAPTVTITATP